VGVPFSGGQPKGGVDQGPFALRDAGLLSAIQSLGLKVTHNEDIVIPSFEPSEISNAKQAKWVGNVCQRVAGVVEKRRKEGDFVLTLGGDHSIAVGSISGILSAHPDVFVVWVDAHADINTPGTSNSGNMHGMPVAFLAGLVGGSITGFEWRTDDGSYPCLDLNNIVYIGLRDVDPGEKALLKEHHVKAFFMEDVERLSIAEIMKQTVDASKGKPIHISFDIDALDPSHAPATGTPVHGGLSLHEGRYICEIIAQTGQLVSMDMVEVNPSLSDKSGSIVTVNSALSLIECTLRKTLT